jgi:DNA processing protein
MQFCSEGVIHAELKNEHVAGATLIDDASPLYPPWLRGLTDAPPFLWILGYRSLLQQPAISMVGTRMAKSLAAELCQAGYVIVWGLARGVDAATHFAALCTDTIAVQAGSVDIMYPA